MGRIVFLLTCLSMAGLSVLSAQEDAAPGTETDGPKITVHGYLTQAYAQSNAHQFLGITEDGTSDYRTAALQVRADLGPEEAFVIQLSHERLGKSGLQELQDDVALDWLFYERQFGASSVKVGRVQIPFGIYNEVRDVGTLLPFYRPSLNFYGEAAYGSETLEGIVLSHQRTLGGGWELAADLHYGDWKFIGRDLAGLYGKSKVQGSVGGELWLDTPVSGLRIGGGAMRYAINDSVTGDNTWTASHLSLDGDFDRFAVQAEIKDVELGTFGSVTMGYIRLGVDITPKLTLSVQQDVNGARLNKGSRDKLDDDRALGATYALSPSLVLKAEHHWNKGLGFWLEDLLSFGTTRYTIRYWIASLSTSF